MLYVLSRCGSYNCYYNDIYWTLYHDAAHTTVIIMSHAGRSLTLRLIQLLLYLHFSRCGSHNSYYNVTCWTFSHVAADTTAIIMTHAGRYLAMRLTQQLFKCHMLDVLSGCGSYNCYYNYTCWTLCYDASHTTAYNIVTCWTFSHFAAHTTAIIITHAGRYLTMRLTQQLF